MNHGRLHVLPIGRLIEEPERGHPNSFTECVSYSEQPGPREETASVALIDLPGTLTRLGV